jgi:hypothetical protein
MSRAAERDEEKIRSGIKQAEFVKKGTSFSLLFYDMLNFRGINELYRNRSPVSLPQRI